MQIYTHSVCTLHVVRTCSDTLHAAHTCTLFCTLHIIRTLHIVCTLILCTCTHTQICTLHIVCTQMYTQIHAVCGTNRHACCITEHTTYVTCAVHTHTRTHAVTGWPNSLCPAPCSGPHHSRPLCFSPAHYPSPVHATIPLRVLVTHCASWDPHVGLHAWVL